MFHFPPEILVPKLWIQLFSSLLTYPLHSWQGKLFQRPLRKYAGSREMPVVSSLIQRCPLTL